MNDDGTHDGVELHLFFFFFLFFSLFQIFF